MNEQAEPPREKEHGETEPRTGPRIYVASLSDYNAGRLHGEWIDAAQDDEDVWEQVNVMLATSPEPIAEEWAIHDYEGFGPVHLGEWEDLATVTRLARGIAEHGQAFAAWAVHLERGQWDQLDQFEDHYLGCWESLEAFAESLLDDMGIDVDALGPEHLQAYVRFDLEAFARDLRHDVGVVTVDEGVHVFEQW